MRLTKQIIQRRLPLTVKYSVVNKQYIPLLEGFGTCCDNCGKLIANIATVKSADHNIYNIGFDCLETFLINNELLSGKDIAEYLKTKSMIPKILRFAKTLKEVRGNGDGWRFERPTIFYEMGWVTFYHIRQGCKPYNDGVKLKDVDFDFLIETLKNIFPGCITVE